MRESNAFLVFFAIALTLSCAVSAQESAPSLLWQAGVAVVDITPTEPMWLAGYAGRNHPADGTLLPLHAKALALQDAEGHRALLITTDLLGFPKPLSDRIRTRIQEKTQLDRAAIILSASHTHSGPVLPQSLLDIYPLDEAQLQRIDTYSRALEDNLVSLAEAALVKLEPAQLAAGTGVVRFAVNRRNNTEADVPKLHALNGPNDHAVPVIRITRPDGALIAAVFGYACHATTLDIYQWSGDHPGFAQDAFEKAHPGATALFFAGCGADQNPLPRRTIPLARQYGRELAAAVDRVLEDPMRPLPSTLATAYTELDLPLAGPPTRESLAQTASTLTGIHQKCAQSLLKRVEAGEPLRQSYPYPIQMWRIGDQPLITLGGEVVVDYAIACKAMFGNDTFVMGYANDVMAYIPSLRVLQEGRYEGTEAQILYGLPAPWDNSVETRIMTAIQDTAAKAGVSPLSTSTPAPKP